MFEKGEYYCLKLSLRDKTSMNTGQNQSNRESLPKRDVLGREENICEGQRREKFDTRLIFEKCSVTI